MAAYSMRAVEWHFSPGPVRAVGIRHYGVCLATQAIWEWQDESINGTAGRHYWYPQGWNQCGVYAKSTLVAWSMTEEAQQPNSQGLRLGRAAAGTVASGWHGKKAKRQKERHVFSISDVRLRLSLSLWE